MKHTGMIHCRVRAVWQPPLSGTVTLGLSVQQLTSLSRPMLVSRTWLGGKVQGLNDLSAFLNVGARLKPPLMRGPTAETC